MTTGTACIHRGRITNRAASNIPPLANMHPQGNMHPQAQHAPIPLCISKPNARYKDKSNPNPDPGGEHHIPGQGARGHVCDGDPQLQGRAGDVLRVTARFRATHTWPPIPPLLLGPLYLCPNPTRVRTIKTTACPGRRQTSTGSLTQACDWAPARAWA